MNIYSISSFANMIAADIAKHDNTRDGRKKITYEENPVDDTSVDEKSGFAQHTDAIDLKDTDHRDEYDYSSSFRAHQYQPPDIRGERQTFGIACCRYNSDRLEILLVCKRFTYAFSAFAHGRYNASRQSLMNLFNNMTCDEKIIIMSLNFSSIWFHVWLNNTKTSSTYYKSKSKFESYFLVDGGTKLREMIMGSHNAQRLWELPKGKQNSRNENGLMTAIREFSEETGIQKSSYKLFAGATANHVYMDDGVRYANKYFIALATDDIQPTIKMHRQKQIDEIADLRWMSIDHVRFVDTSGQNLTGVVKRIFAFMRKQKKYYRCVGFY